MIASLRTYLPVDDSLELDGVVDKQDHEGLVLLQPLPVQVVGVAAKVRVPCSCCVVPFGKGFVGFGFLFLV
jgi:hypothetical protein